VTDPVTQVVVAGGGPVGMAMAIDLALKGVRSIVIEQGDGVITHGRGGHVNERTIELARRWGIQDRVTRSGFDGDVPMGTILCTNLRGYEVARAGDFAPAGERHPSDASPGYEVRCPQTLLEPILQRRAAEFDEITVLWRHRCTAVTQDRDGVRATVLPVDGAGEPFSVSGAYLVAADGLNSPVRESLGISRSGDPLINYSISSVISAPGLARVITLDPALRYTFMSSEGCWGNITSYGDNDHWRLTVILDKARPDLSDFDPATYFRRAAGTDELAFKVETIRPWRRSELIADTFQSGRVFLAGDAAHTMSPTGGYGLNTGFADVDNLGWKLAARFEGWAGDGLLDSYTAERHDAAVRNATFANRHFRGWMHGVDCGPVDDDTTEGERARAWVGRTWVEGIAGEYNAIGGALGYCYEKSPICVPDGVPAPIDEPGEYLETTRPGSRAPHYWIEPDRSTLDLFGQGFVLVHDTSGEAVRVAQEIATVAAGLNVPVELFPIGDDELRRRYERDLVLVRPDGYVGWRSGAVLNESIPAVIDVVRGAS
jgi:2-polyprenyl-6-methoxyphenol hydroxylase-like FAD-dependent oxidoreductase